MIMNWLLHGKGMCTNLLANIKNTISDRHIVQRNFNDLLESYGSEMLPDIVTSWKEMSLEEQQHVSLLNNFSCGFHLIVGMADTTSSVLRHWEPTNVISTTGSGIIVRKSESGTVRLV